MADNNRGSSWRADPDGDPNGAFIINSVPGIGYPEVGKQASVSDADPLILDPCLDCQEGVEFGFVYIAPNSIVRAPQSATRADAESLELLFIDDGLQKRLSRASEAATEQAIKDRGKHKKAAAAMPNKNKNAPRRKKPPDMKTKQTNTALRKRCGRCRLWKTTECQCTRKTKSRKKDIKCSGLSLNEGDAENEDDPGEPLFEDNHVLNFNRDNDPG